MLNEYNFPYTTAHTTETLQYYLIPRIVAFPERQIIFIRPWIKKERSENDNRKSVSFSRKRVFRVNEEACVLMESKGAMLLSVICSTSN